MFLYIPDLKIEPEVRTPVRGKGNGHVLMVTL
jgi:hypothetical protein